VIILRPAKERQHARRRRYEEWSTFDARNPADPLANGFGVLESLNESRLRPGASASRHSQNEAEILTYVREGTLSYSDSLGGACVLRAGEFQRMTLGRGIRRNGTNSSHSDPAHAFQIWLRPAQRGVEPSQDQKRFSAAERRGLLCVVASPDGRRGSLRIAQDALLHSALLEPGQHLVHELGPGRIAWLHLVEGEVALPDGILDAGDGAGISEDRAVSFTAREASEILLLDLHVACEGVDGFIDELSASSPRRAASTGRLGSSD
jgi:redox-sensitive bicupin YhaK (pirin superfamily)